MMTNNDDRFIYTTRSILDGSAPVAIVVHDWNDEWHFWGQEGEIVAEARVALFREIIATDNGLTEIAELPMGSKASRKNLQDTWHISIIKKHADDNINSLYQGKRNT
jgi:hypothetical protein